MITSAEAFILENTKVITPPHTPEVRLHLADDSIALWRKTEEDLGEIGLPPPFWAFAWAGGQALARYVLDHPQALIGRTVLDMASGSGLVGIAAMLAGARSAECADIDPFAAVAARLNAALNGMSVQVSSRDALSLPADADVILVGDFFYERDLAARLLTWLTSAAAAGKTVLIGDPGRAYLPQNALVRVAHYAIPVSRDLEDCEVKRTAVWRLA